VSSFQEACYAFNFEQTQLTISAQLDKKKIPLLNFIHKDLHQNIARKIPVNDNPHFEIYHRATFQGVELDVCVYFPAPQNENGKECYAMVKVVDDDLSSEESAPIYIDAMFNADAKADSFTEKNATLAKNYWAPRWKVCSSA
jgi:DNA-directed RNA polymerase specialized sigma54-like protein